MLKAGNAYHKYRVKRNCWPKVRGVAMNPVEHPHGGGNHEHIGHASTVRRDAPSGLLPTPVRDDPSAHGLFRTFGLNHPNSVRNSCPFLGALVRRLQRWTRWDIFVATTQKRSRECSGAQAPPLPSSIPNAASCEVPPKHTTKSHQAPPRKKRIADSVSCSPTVLSDSEPPFVQSFAALREWEEHLTIDPHLSPTKTMKFAPAPKLFPSVNHDSDSDDQGVVAAPNLAKRPRTEDGSSLALLDSSRKSTSPLRLREKEKDSTDNRGGYRAKVVSDAHPLSSVKLPTRPLTSADSALQDPDVASAMFHGAHLPVDLAYATDGLTADHCTSLYQSLEHASLDSLHLVRAFNLYASQGRRMKAELYGADGKSGLHAKCDQLLVERDAARLEIETLRTEKENLLKSQDKALKKCLKDREVELQKLYSKEITRVCEEYRKEAEEHTALAVKQVRKELTGPKKSVLAPRPSPMDSTLPSLVVTELPPNPFVIPQETSDNALADLSTAIDIVPEPLTAVNTIQEPLSVTEACEDDPFSVMEACEADHCP
ncbi:hypothetical protein IFM89_005197 [Coptis chinensis]|uniref:Large ribosomal subunit protein uL2 C-terminal domain-containing protein n=1 Tax=Coptis chinensis TaxID=261450 RepID=A0A835LWY2_9MAGN|nr:hypothetical protein IFM89_005197 [Coptis chinensis]